MMLTLFCDASYCHQTQAAGWGAWAKRDDWSRGQEFGGDLCAYVTNCGEAEMRAIACSIATLRSKGELSGVSRLMIQSDSTRALALLLKRIDGVMVSDHADAATITPAKILATPNEITALGVVESAIGNIQITVRHVRGHQKGDGRSWVNRRCDHIAKKYMRAARRRSSAVVERRPS